MELVITVKNLKKRFNQQELYQNISFKINKGEFVAIFGPNGCGKTTILNILSKLIKKDSGDINLKDFNPNKFSYVFQNYRDSLLPWKNNYENIVFPLKLQNKQNGEIKRILDELQVIFNLNIDLKKYPYELSGGQQQILSFTRALINKPEILFIDEPFSALDYENNLILRKHLQNYYLKYKPTILMITHNIEEAAHLANKIMVLSKSPTKIVKIIENPEEYPRTLEFLKSKPYYRIKDEVLDAFKIGANL